MRNFLWLVFLASLWGPSFLFIKVAGEDIPPLTMVVGRVGVAAVLLYLILRMQGRNLPKFGITWKHFAVMAFFQNALPFALFNWGEQHIDSALAGSFNGIDRRGFQNSLQDMKLYPEKPRLPAK